MVSKFKAFSIVVEKVDLLNTKIILIDDLNNYCKDNDGLLFYAIIEHDKDVDKDLVGNIINVRNHYHLVLVFQNEYSKNSVLNDIASKLLINKNIISIRGCKNLISSVQYLIHKNDNDKYHYDVNEIWCNDYNELFKILYDSMSVYELDMDYLIDLVKKSDSLHSLYSELGMKLVRRYRPIINDLWKEMRIDNKWG